MASGLRYTLSWKLLGFFKLMQVAELEEFKKLSVQKVLCQAVIT